MDAWDIFERLRIPDYDDTGQIAHGRVIIDEDLCCGCGLCVKACPADALTVQAKTARFRSADNSECIHCGDCQAICPEDAISLGASFCYSGYYATIDHGEIQPPRL